MTKKQYNFGEKTTEWSSKQGKELPVWRTPKYEHSREKAVQVIEEYDDIHEGDFWILMNESKNGKMIYSGLIISHNACLKINEHLAEEKRFKPECVTLDKAGFANTLVYTYCCPEQGIYEVGEASPTNLKNPYPYAMALKRCMDRVILKNSKIAFEGIYSVSEADEFKERQDDGTAENKSKKKSAQVTAPNDQQRMIAEIYELAEQKNIPTDEICSIAGKPIEEMYYPGQMRECINWLKSEPRR